MTPLRYYIQTEIENNAYTIARSMVKINVIEQHKPDFRKWGKYVYDVLEPEFRKAEKLEFRPEYCVWVRSVAGRGFIDDIYSYILREIQFPIEFSSKIPWPQFFRVDGLATHNMWTGLVLHDNPIWYELRDELAAYNAVVERYYEQRRAFIDGVKKICSHYDTINEALAAWPALRGLLPEGYAQVNFSFDGTPKALPDGVDIAELTAAVVRAKLTEV